MSTVPAAGSMFSPKRSTVPTDSSASLLELQQRLDRLFTSSGYRPMGVSAKVVSLKTGRVLYERNADLPLTPASTTKLFTTASLHLMCGPEARLHTEARSNGTLEPDGTLRGDLYLVGCGDALLTVADVEDLADRVRAAGVQKITGQIIGDGSRFDAMTSRSVYSGDNEEVEATGEITALNINRGTVGFLVSASRSGVANVQPIPASDAISVESRVRVIAPRRRPVISPKRGSAGRARQAAPTRRRPSRSVNRRGDAPMAPRYRRHSVARIHAQAIVQPNGKMHYIVTGSISSGSSTTVYAQIKRPALFAAGVLSQRLRSGGVEVGTLIAERRCPQGSTLIAQTGRPLLDFTSVVNKRSDNHLAEHAFKMCGYRSGVNPSTAAASRAAVLKALDSLGVQRSGLLLNDGSGLSRRNVVSASTQVDLLRACSQQVWGEEFRNSLAIAGVDGSIRRRMISTPAMQNVRAKTGTLRNVSSLAGYVSTLDGEPLVFSFISNGAAVSSYKFVEDAAAVALAGFSWNPAAVRMMQPQPLKIDSMKDKVTTEKP
ncbi:MAG: D-alanyl-D-alanine carboxypeptidase/D-alanyl-D-alanine-endopeptidase [Candidatus Kapabacteria bacterium]|nr:D-alanyl-D-alanine carboxypeptidase/D-alanyl-D-alanine-endopeptidase [Candidatus Kapabacteria bacterium]